MNDADREILDHFSHIRGRTVAMLEATPDELLGRTAEGEDNPVGWQFPHIANGVEWWMNFVMQDGQGWSGDYPSERGGITAYLNESADRLLTFFQADDGAAMGRTFERSPEKQPEGGQTQWVGRSRVLYLTAHELHHLGRLELALWQFGVTDLPHFP